MFSSGSFVRHYLGDENDRLGRVISLNPENDCLVLWASGEQAWYKQNALVVPREHEKKNHQ